MMGENGCKVKQAEAMVMAFLAGEDYCGICRRSFKEILELLERIRAGNAARSFLDIIAELAGRVSSMCRCGRGKGLAAEIISILQQHRDDFTVHIENRVCPSSECPRLSLAPCQAACPAGIDIPNYVALVGKSKFEEALERIKEDVPLPGSLGRICEHPCERACRRAEIDRAINICALKRVAYDECTADENVPPAPERKYKEKVAVIGAGPAGLSAAYFLALRGYGVTVFEAMSHPGGMLAYGIPPYRLPREVLRTEIDYIKSMGVEIRLNTPIGGDYNIEDLKAEGYAAIFLGTGAWKGSIPLPNAESFTNVWDGISLLSTVNQGLMDEKNEKIMDLTGKKVIVVGGGNVAVDAARVCLRLGAQEVRMVYRRTREEMPALVEEITDAEKEGIIFDFLVSPVSAGGEAGQATYLECLRNELSVPDAGGRRKPVPVENSEFKIEADLIVFATGQQPELSFLETLAQGAELEVARGRIAADPYTMETSLPGVFAGGDAVTGPASAIKAMAAGKRAAASIDAYLRGERPGAGIKYPVKRKSEAPLPVSAEQKAASSRVDFHRLYQSEKKDTFEEIMQRISREDAAAEAARCLRCDLCTACGKCVKNCQEQVGVGALELGYVSGAKSTKTDFMLAENKCIGCGTCSVNCPTGAITVEDNDGYREMRMCGSLISRLELVSCRVCGQTFAAQKQLDHINKNIGSSFSPDFQGHDVCPECARKAWSQNVFGRGIAYPTC